MGFWITSCTTLKGHPKLLRSLLPSSRRLGVPPSFPIAPGQYPASADAHSHPAQRPVPRGGGKGWKAQLGSNPSSGTAEEKEGPWDAGQTDALLSEQIFQVKKKEVPLHGCPPAWGRGGSTWGVHRASPRQPPRGELPPPYLCPAPISARLQGCV